MIPRIYTRKNIETIKAQLEAQNETLPPMLALLLKSLQ